MFAIDHNQFKIMFQTIKIYNVAEKILM